MAAGLKDKVAFVTGGASGLGKAIAQRLASEGARVIISDIERRPGESTAAECGFTFFEQNVTDEARWPEIVREIESRFERLDIMVNNAGILGPMDVANPENTRLDDWRKVFEVNVDGVFLGCRAAIQSMRRSGGGSIINISSVAGLLASPYATAYGASKATVRHLTKSVAQHCAQEKLNVRCNSVHPGNVRDPRPHERASMWEGHAEKTARARGVSLAEILAETQAGTALGDLTRPEDVAAAVAFLASDDARHITGEQLIVDGGLVNCDTFRLAVKRP